MLKAYARRGAEAMQRVLQNHKLCKKYEKLHLNAMSVNLQVATRAARKQANIKMGFLNHSVFTLVFDEPADSVITSVANITTWCRSN